MTASTYPLEVVMAARWTKENPGVKGDALDQAMQKQPWDPSVKGLTARAASAGDDEREARLDGAARRSLPGAAGRCHQDGSAAARQGRSHRQPQVDRADQGQEGEGAGSAPAAGCASLAPVVVQEPEYIEIEPAAPDVVYVPVYDPVVVYGAWPYPVYRPFFWYPPGYVYAGGIGFGAGFVVGAALWCHYDWYHRSVWIDTRRYNRFNHAHLTGSRARWTHNPNHRGIVPYKSAKLRQEFSHSRYTPRATGKAIPNTRIAPKTATRGNGHAKTAGAVAKRNTIHPGVKPKPLHTANTPRVTHTGQLATALAAHGRGASDQSPDGASGRTPAHAAAARQWQRQSRALLSSA